MAMDFVKSSSEEVKEAMTKVVVESIRAGQQKLTEMKEGIFFLDFRRASEPMVKQLTEQGMAIHPLAVDNFFVHVFLLDLFYSNNDFTQFSVVALEGYRKWSKFMDDKFPGYEFDLNYKRLIRKTAETLNFDDVISLFKSKEWRKEDEEEFMRKIDASQTMFLDEKCKVPKILFCSYPRSGNTLTRKYFESITGIATGATMPNTFVLNFQMAALGFKGETYYDDKIWLYKSHHPFILTGYQNQMCNRVIVCIRNPLDAIVSQLQFRLTTTNSRSTANNVQEEFPLLWEKYVQETTLLWKNQIDYWMVAAKNKSIPVYFFRYEDLFSDPEPILNEMFSFSLGLDSIKGTFIQKRIKQVLELGEAGRTLYKQRDTGDFRKNFDKYSQDQFETIGNECQEQIKFCQYFKSKGSDQENPLAYFEYDTEIEESKVDLNFKESNKANLEWVSMKDNEEIHKFNIDIMNIVENSTHLGKYTTMDLNIELFKAQEKIFIKA